MSTPRRRRWGETVDALFASLFILTLGLITGFVVGLGLGEDAKAVYVRESIMVVSGKPYRVQPLEMR